MIDFKAPMCHPDQPNWLQARRDLGDGLHSSVEGYGAMADAVAPKLFGIGNLTRDPLRIRSLLSYGRARAINPSAERLFV
jgi:hypothetical protein